VLHSIPKFVKPYMLLCCWGSFFLLLEPAPACCPRPGGGAETPNGISTLTPLEILSSGSEANPADNEFNVEVNPPYKVYLPLVKKNVPSVTNLRWFIGLGTGADPAQITVEQHVADDFNASHPDIHLTSR